MFWETPQHTREEIEAKHNDPSFVITEANIVLYGTVNVNIKSSTNLIERLKTFIVCYQFDEQGKYHGADNIVRLFREHDCDVQLEVRFNISWLGRKFAQWYINRIQQKLKGGKTV
jgi:hypothetical protein